MSQPLSGAEARRRMFAFREELAARATSATPSDSPPAEVTPEQQREVRRARGRAQYEARQAERLAVKRLANDMLRDLTVPLFVEDRKELLDEARRVREATETVEEGIATYYVYNFCMYCTLPRI